MTNSGFGLLSLITFFPLAGALTPADFFVALLYCPESQ